MLNNLSIRKKLALVALGPLLLLLVLSVIRIRGDLGDISDASDVQGRSTASAVTGLLFEAVRVESVENQNAVAISGLDLDGVRSETDAAIERWEESVGAFSSIDGGALASAVGDFNAHRADVAAQFGSPNGAEGVLAADAAVLRTIAAFDGLLSQSADSSGNDLREASDLTTVAQRAAELQLHVMWSAHSRVVPPGLVEAIGAADASADAYGLRSGVELPLPTGSYDAMIDEFDGLSVGDAVGISPNDWRTASEARATQLLDVRGDKVRAASQAAAEAQSSAQSAMRFSGLLALLGLIATLVMIFLVARSFISALAALRDEATQVAETDLPALADSLATGRPYVPAESEGTLDQFGESEFGEVASGISSIKESASGLGTHVTSLQSGIANTYVNLARRNQALVERQLEAIDTLEAEERDSDRLALMYRVDHLATRMRRNAESLLVLADAKTPERHSSAVELREVLRVAIGEVEDYRRIIPIALDDLFVAGHRAQDFAHLLAELMENAAQHSPPGTAVDVSGAFEGSSGDYIVTVLDHGTGVDEQQLASLNGLLQRAPSSTLTISHSIGLHVVSRLAHSLGLSVTLDHGTESGLVAAVRVPSAVVAEWAHTAPAAARPAASRPTPTAPVEPTVAPAPVAEVFAPTPEPVVEAPTAPPVPPETPAAPMQIDPTMTLPDAPAIPTIDMPELDLPSFGSTDAPEAPDLSEVFGAPIEEASASEFVFEPEALAPEVFEPEAALPDVSVPEAAPVEIPESLPEMPAPVAEVPQAPQAPAPAAEVFSTIDTPPFEEPPLAAREPIAPAPPAPQSVVPDPVQPEPAIEQHVAVAPQPPPVEAPAVFEPPPAPVPVESAPAPAAAHPVAESVAPAAPVTPAGLVKRQRQTTESVPQVDLTADRTAPSQRTPDQVKNMLSRYKTGLERGRGAPGTEGES